MFIVAVVNVKGGCGKTTLATHLAAWYARGGHRVILGDLDRQRSASQWVKTRPDDLPAIKGVPLDIDAMELPFGPGRMVIDVPAGLKRKALDVVVRAADALVVPLLPSAFDEAATERFLSMVGELKPVRKGRRPVALVPNRIRRNSLAARRLDTFLEGLSYPAVARLSDSTVYPASAASGRTLFDLPTGRSRPLRSEWAPLLALLDELTEDE